MKISTRAWLAVAAFSLALTAFAGEFKVNLSTDKKDAIYRKGETVTFIVNVTEDGKPLNEGNIKCKVVGRTGGDYLKEKSFPLNGDTVKIELPAETPGWMMLEVRPFDAEGKAIVLNPKAQKWDQGVQRIGAMVDPLDIKVAVPEPKDFDAFWKAQRAELDKVPVKATETEVEAPANQKGKFLLYDVKVDCAGGMPVSGYLSIPVNAKPKSLPAVVSYHGAGVRSSSKSFTTGAIRLDVNAHGIVNGEPEDFYKKLAAGELKDYRTRGSEDRDQVYFKGMFLRVMRALDYVKSRPEWDGKTLIVRGGSQGGGQSLVAAALDPQVTLCLASVPAIGDHNAMAAGRQPGWPRFLQAKLTDEQKKNVSEAVAYYDYVNFCKRIKCETVVSTGFIDTVCVPSSVYAGFNNIPAGVKKSIITAPNTGHGNTPFKAADERMNQVLAGK